MDEPWPDDILVVACMRVKNTDLIVPGSLVKACARCESSVWVSPATRDHVRDKPHRFVCMECMLQVAAKDDDPQMVPVTNEQLEEIKLTMESGGLTPPTTEELRHLKDSIEREGLVPTARRVLNKEGLN
jgi:hypothetical protein